MKVVIKQGEDGKFTADRPRLPGSPPIGRGHTWKEALGDLVNNDPKAFNLGIVLVEDKCGKPYRFKPNRRR